MSSSVFGKTQLPSCSEGKTVPEMDCDVTVHGLRCPDLFPTSERLFWSHGCRRDEEFTSLTSITSITSITVPSSNSNNSASVRNEGLAFTFLYLSLALRDLEIYLSIYLFLDYYLREAQQIEPQAKRTDLKLEIMLGLCGKNSLSRFHVFISATPVYTATSV